MTTRKISEDEWLSLLHSMQNSTFFHSPFWYRVWRQYNGWKYDCYHFLFESGSTGMLPLIRRSSLGIFPPQYISSPAGTYGGPITSGLLTQDDKDALHTFITSFSNLQMTSSPLQPSMEGFNFWTSQDFTHMIDLRQGLDTIISQWTKGEREALRKSQKQNIIIHATNPDHWHDYMQLYHAWKAGKQRLSIQYRVSLFEALSEVPTDHWKLWTAEYRDQLIYGIITFYFNTHVVSWHSAGLRDYYYTRVTNLLWYEILCDAVAKGFQWFDFNPSGGFTGAARFKSRLGAQPFPVPKYNKQSKLHTTIARLKRKFV